MGRRNVTKEPPCNAIDAEYKGYCGIGHKIPSFSELRSSCIIMWTCRRPGWLERPKEKTLLHWNDRKLQNENCTVTFEKGLRTYTRTSSICYKDIFRICGISITCCNTCCNVISTNSDTLHMIRMSQKQTTSLFWKTIIAIYARDKVAEDIK
jgi:hypothetical protein